MVPIGWTDDSFQKDGDSSTDCGSVSHSIGPTRLAFKRFFGIEACHVRDRDEACHGVGSGKFHRVDVVRIDGVDQIRA